MTKAELLEIIKDYPGETEIVFTQENQRQENKHSVMYLDHMTNAPGLNYINLYFKWKKQVTGQNTMSETCENCKELYAILGKREHTILKQEKRIRELEINFKNSSNNSQLFERLFFNTTSRLNFIEEQAIAIIKSGDKKAAKRLWDNYLCKKKQQEEAVALAEELRRKE